MSEIVSFEFALRKKHKTLVIFLEIYLDFFQWMPFFPNLRLD